MTPKFSHTYYLNLKDISTALPFGKSAIAEDNVLVSYMAVPCKIDRGGCIRVIQKELQLHENVYYAYSEKFTAAYLASVFNSNLGWRFLSDSVFPKTHSVCLQETDLTKVPIFDASLESQHYLGELQLWIQTIFNDEINRFDSLKSLADRSRLMLDLFEDIRDGLVLQLYFSEVFKQRGIRLWEIWTDILSQHSKLADMEKARVVFDVARGLSSPVRQALKSIQVLRNSPNFQF